MVIKRIVVSIIAFCFITGCAGQTVNQSTIPTGCEKSIVYTKLPGFMPNGPMVIRVGISTALAVAATAGHPEVKMLVAMVMPMLYKATLTNTLGSGISDVKEKFKIDKVINYVTPFITLFDSLNQAGITPTGGTILTDCDKNVLASLFKNIGIDAGADPALFN